MSNNDAHSFSCLKYEHFNAMSKRDNEYQHGNKMVEIFSLDAVVKC